MREEEVKKDDEGKNFYNPQNIEHNRDNHVHCFNTNFGNQLHAYLKKFYE